MGLLDRAFGIEQRVAEAEKRISKAADAKVKRELEKQTKVITKALDGYFDDQSHAVQKGAKQPGALRWAMPPQGTAAATSFKKKPDSSVPFSVLRRFSVQHDISRACINTRKRQINQLEWDIVSAEDDQQKPNEKSVKLVKLAIKQMSGRSNTYKRIIDKIIEDLLVLDAVALEKQRTRGGQFFGIAPIDAATIQLRLDQSGGTPEPPEVAYKQIIRGEVVAELTADEMVYEMMNPRSNSAYGLAPMESLVVAISSSLKAALYNLGYLTDGNIPEGLFQVPEGWKPDMIKEFQENWDAAMAGNELATSRLKMVPGGKGAGYTPTKKPGDMMWGEFNSWLMKITCSIFDVQPMEIGFEPDTGLGGAGYSEQQSVITNRRAILPLAHFIEDIFTNIIQIDMGMPDLKFSFKGLIEKDAKGMAETNAILINSGQRTVDELRTDEGLKPLGIDKPFVMGTPTFIDEESMAAKEEAAAALAQSLNAPAEDDKEDPKDEKNPPVEEDTQKSASPEEMHVALVSEMRTFRKYAVDRKKNGKAIRPFASDVLPEGVVDEMNKRISDAPDVEAVRGIFKEYMDDYQIKFLADVIELKDSLRKVV